MIVTCKQKESYIITKNYMSRKCADQLLKQKCKDVGILQDFAHNN